MNNTSIAAALATRFSAAHITAPSGYSNVALSAYRLPNAITTTPTVLVFPSDNDFAYSGHKRSSDLVFPVRFYIAETSDRPRAIDALYAWRDVLEDQLEAKYDLGLSTAGVTHAVVVSSTAGTGDYAEKEYAVVELMVGVHHEAGYTPTTS